MARAGPRPRHCARVSFTGGGSARPTKLGPSVSPPAGRRRAVARHRGIRGQVHVRDPHHPHVRPRAVVHGRQLQLVARTDRPPPAPLAPGDVPGVGFVQQRAHGVERVVRASVGWVARRDRAVAASGLAQHEGVRAAVQVPAHGDDAATRRHREALGALVYGSRRPAARDRVLGVGHAWHHTEPVGLDRSEAGRGLHGHAVLGIGLPPLVTMVHDHPDHLPSVLGHSRVAVAARERERTQLLARPVEALAHAALRTGAVLAPVVRAAVGEDVVMEHQLALGDLDPVRIDYAHIHADDEARHRRGRDHVGAPERLVAADVEGADAKDVGGQRRVGPVPGGRGRGRLHGQLS